MKTGKLVLLRLNVTENVELRNLPFISQIAMTSHGTPVRRTFTVCVASSYSDDNEDGDKATVHMQTQIHC